MPLNAPFASLNGSPLRQSIHKIAKLAQEKKSLAGTLVYGGPWVWGWVCWGWGRCVFGGEPWVGEWVLDKWHRLYNANTHYKHKYNVLNSIWPKSGLSEFWKNTPGCDKLCKQVWQFNGNVNKMWHALQKKTWLKTRITLGIIQMRWM